MWEIDIIQKINQAYVDIASRHTKTREKIRTRHNHFAASSITGEITEDGEHVEPIAVEIGYDPVGRCLVALSSSWQRHWRSSG